MDNLKLFITDKAVGIVCANLRNLPSDSADDIVTMYNKIYDAIEAKIGNTIKEQGGAEE